jgi:hypothetical protein
MKRIRFIVARLIRPHKRYLTVAEASGLALAPGSLRVIPLSSRTAAIE